MEVTVSHPPALPTSPSTIGNYAWSFDEDDVDAIGRIHVLLREVGKIDLCLVHHVLCDTSFAYRCCRTSGVKPVYQDSVGLSSRVGTRIMIDCFLFPSSKDVTTEAGKH